jgi:hypothetical protein
MIIEYLFSSPEGDILLHPEDLRQPFLISPSQKHPFLFLGDYMYAVKKFILDEKSNILIRIFDKHTSPDHIQKIKICSEKHGALYHISSVEISIGDAARKLCIISALSEKAQKYMTAEFQLLRDLRKKYDYLYIPEAFSMRNIGCNTGNGEVRFLMLCTEWFEDYHEWHLAPNNGQFLPFIWDLKHGYRFVSFENSFEVYKQIALILTLYYNPNDFRQILSWHNSAGDFVVRIHNGMVDVKLTTIREYGSLTNIPEGLNPMIAMVYFFIILTLKIRLDKLNGVGDVVWAGTYSVEACLKGFFRALKIMEGTGRYNLCNIDDLILLLKSFNTKEIQELYDSCLNLYHEDDPEEEIAIQKGLRHHVHEFQECIKGFSE